MPNDFTMIAVAVMTLLEVSRTSAKPPGNLDTDRDTVSGGRTTSVRYSQERPAANGTVERRAPESWI